jgi:hypothetical protein
LRAGRLRRQQQAGGERNQSNVREWALHIQPLSVIFDDSAMSQKTRRKCGA